VEILSAAALLVIYAYGLGTVASLLGHGTGLESSATLAVENHLCWQQLASTLDAESGMLYAIDYSVAPQLEYYSGRETYTGWGQYRIWGIPPIEKAVIISMDYLPEEHVDRQIRQTFSEVDGPRHLDCRWGPRTQEIRTWQVAGPRVGKEEVIERLDFLTLLQEAE
jgi:hypothetical protein